MTIPSLTLPPDTPQRSDPATFPAKADAYVSWQADTNAPEMVATVTAMNLAVNAVNDNTVAALAHANNAYDFAVAASASAASVGLPWTAGTYAVGDMRYSPIDFSTYRCRVAGASATDPSADSVKWAPSVAIPGIGGATITGNTTLTVTSDGAISVAPATPGLYVTLPVATTCREGGMLYGIYNAGDYDYGVKDSAGTQLGWVRPHTGAMIGLADNTTAAGVWTYYGLEKLGITGRYDNPTPANTGTVMRVVALDATRDCVFFGGTTIYAVVLDTATATWGTAVAVRTGCGSGIVGACLSATDQVLAVTCDATTGVEAVTLSISSTTVTVNTGTKATATLASNVSALSTVKLVGTSCVVSYVRVGTVAGIRAISISGTTPTIGAESSLSGTVYEPMLFASGSVVRAFSLDGTNLYAAPFTVSGSSLSAGTATSVALAPACTPRIFQAGSGNIIAQYVNTTLYGAIFKLTGTVEAASTVSLTAAPSTATATYYEVAAISSTKTLFLSCASGSVEANILTDTAGTASAGTALTLAGAAVVQVSVGLISGNLVPVCFSGSNRLNLVTYDCSGSSPTLSGSTALVTNSGDSSIGVPQATEFRYARRYPYTLRIAGGSHTVFGNAYTGEARVSLKGITRTPSALIAGTSGASHPTYDAVSYMMAAFDGSTGTSIQRVEYVA